MDKLYYYETIEEFEKELVSKSITLDTIYTANANLFECFIRAIRTATIWICLVSCIIMTINKGFISGLTIFIGFVIIYIISAILVSWVKYNHHEAFKINKINLIENLLIKCKEFQETNYDDWARKQMLKKFGLLAGVELE